MSEKPKEEEVENLFEKLDACVQKRQSKKGLKLVEEILKLNPKDEDAIKCQVVLLLEAEKFTDALTCIKKHKLEQHFAFEKAYALYRLTHYDEALATVGMVGEDRREARLQLQAQLAYRLGEGQLALDRYWELHKELQSASPELEVNLIAAALMAGKVQDALTGVGAGRGRGGSASSFEALFNRACGWLHLGEYERAQEELLLAERTGQETLLEQGVREAEVEAELAPIAAQLAYTYAKQGRSSECVTLYSQLLGKEAGDDEATLAVVKNNCFAERLAVHSHKKLVADALKKLETCMDKVDRNKLKAELERRLSPEQRETLQVNHALLLIMAGRLEAARSLTTWLLSKSASSPSLMMLHATLLASEKRLGEADHVLAKCAVDHPGAALSARLMRAQLAALQHNHRAALNHLQELQSGSLSQQPGLVASIVGLQLRMGELEPAQKLLQDVLAHWQSQPASPQRNEALEWLLRHLSVVQLKLGDVSSSAASFRHLRQLGGLSTSTSKLLAKLSRALALTNPQEALALEQQIPPLHPEFSAEQLENAVLAGERLQKSRGKRTATAMDTEGPGGAPKAKRRRKKKPRYPKNFDPANPGPMPDPERWLPKWQRSDFKKKRTRRKDKDVVKGSQGAGKVNEALDITSAPAATPSSGGGKSRGSSGGNSAAPKGSAPPKGSGKKGKKGGRK